jgi:fibulin 1/2
MDLSENMKTCVKLDPCHIDNGGCSHYCDSTSQPMCYCPLGYAIDEEDHVTCKELSLQKKCNHGFRLSQHDNETCVDIDECIETPDICQNGHCVNEEGAYKCHCHAGYYSSLDNNTACIDVDECASSPCSHRCLNLPGTYQCLCSYGQVLMVDGHTCGFADLCDLNNGGCGNE